MRDARGNIAVLSASMLSIGIIVAAFAVDYGSLYLERREAQSAADLAAMAAAAQLDSADEIAAATIKANGLEHVTSLVVTKGHYEADEKLAPAQRFKPGVEPFNAVAVELAKPGRTYFAQAFLTGEPELGVKALATNSAQATFSVGSRLLSVKDGLVNKLLGALIGGNVNLTAMDYNALVDANVKLGDFMNALGSEVNVTAGTYNDVLNSNATLNDVLSATAKVTQQNGDSQASAALNSLLSQPGTSNLNVPLGSFADLGDLGQATIGSSNPGLDTSISAMDIVTSAATLANGQHQVTIDLGATIPGLLSLKLDVAIGEPPQHSPWMTVGQPGAIVRTAQTRLKLTAEVGGTGVLAGTRVKLPLYLDVAFAEARLDDLTCTNGDPSTATATIGARPGIADIYIGEVTNAQFTNFSSKPNVAKANIVDVPLIKVKGKAQIEIANTTETMLDFDMTDVEQGTIKSTDTKDYTQSLVSSLLGKTNLEVTVAGLGVGLPATVAATVKAVLQPVAPTLDDILHTLLTTLGVHLGEADVRVHGIRCGTAALAG